MNEECYTPSEILAAFVLAKEYEMKEAEWEGAFSQADYDALLKALRELRSKVAGRETPKPKD